MTETLVLEIQNGRHELMQELWTQTEKFISQQAGIFHEKVKDTCNADKEDFIQSGYLALESAVKNYDAGRGAGFLTVLKYYLLTAFSETAGLRTERTQQDPIHHALSLDYIYAKAGDNDPGDVTLLDMIPDPRDEYQEAEARIYNVELRAALETAIDTLPDKQADAIRGRFFFGMTYKELADKEKVSANNIRQRQQKGLLALRRGRIKNGLDKFLDDRTSFFLRTNFRTSQTSAVERLVIDRDRYRRQYERRHKETP